MRINRLLLKNFRSHRDTDLSLSRINIIRGSHGAGKSSIQMAIELALTGKCDVTDAAGRGAQSLISAGANELLIDAFTDKAELTFRRNSAGGQLIVGQHAGKSATAWVEANIAPIPQLSAVLNGGRFLKMDEREQKALLAGALAADPVAIDPKILTLLSEVTLCGKTAVASAADVDEIHKVLFGLRTQVNRDLKAFGDMTAPEKPDGMPFRKDVTDQIDGLRLQLTTKVRERERTLAEYQGKKDRLEAAHAQVKQHEPNVLETDELTKLDKQAKGKAKAKKLDDEIARLQASIRENRDVLCKLKAPQADTCPTCGQSVACADYSEPIAKYEAGLAKYTAELEAKQGERNKLPDPELAQSRLDRHFAAMQPYQRALGIIKEVGELGAAPDVEAITEQITELEKRITAGSEIERQCVAYEAALKQHEQVVRKAADLQKKSEILDTLVEHFSDRGPLKAKLVGGKLPAFVARMNETLGRFGFFCRFDLEPFELVVSRVVQCNNCELRPQFFNLNQLSESEAFRFAIAFQVALAEATGVNFVVIDRSDLLLPEVRRQLAQALEESSLDQAIVLCAGEPNGNYPVIDGVKFFELSNEDGATAVLDPAEVEA